LQKLKQCLVFADTARNTTPPLLRAGSRRPVRGNWRPMRGASETSEIVNIQYMLLFAGEFVEL